MRKVQNFTTWMIGQGNAAYLPKDYLLALVIWIATFLATVGRVPRDSLNNLWAEDGSRFLTDTLMPHGIDILLTPQAGYMNLAPRLFMEVVTPFIPISALPAFVTLGACLIQAALATLVFLWLKQRLESTLIRACLAFLFAASSVAGFEINGSVANLHWFLIVAAFVYLSTSNNSIFLNVMGLLTVSISILSDPLTILLLPISLIRVFKKDIWRWWIAGTFLVSSGMQIFVILHSTQNSPSPRPAFIDLFRAVTFRSFDISMLGVSPAVSAFYNLGIGILVLFALIMLCLQIFVIFRDREYGGFVLLSLFFALTFAIVPSWLRWDIQLDPQQMIVFVGSRYVYVPTLLLTFSFAGIAMSAAKYIKRIEVAPQVGSKVIPAIFLIWTLFICLVDYSATSRSEKSHWESNIKHALEVCNSNPGLQIAKISVEPKTFKVEVPCEKVKSWNLR